MSDREGILRRAVLLSRTRGISTADGVAALTASGGEPQALIDAEGFFARGMSTNLDRDTWLYTPDADAADQVRLVSQTDPINLAYRTAGPDYGAVPVSGDRYLVLKDHPFRWNVQLNEALRTLLFFPRLDVWTPISDTQRIYTFGTAPLDGITDLDRITQVFNLQWHDGGDATDEERWRDWADDDGRKTWRVYDDAGTLRIEFNGILPGTVDELRFTSLIPHPIVTDDATAMTVDEEWAAYALLMQMGKLYGDPNNPDDEWTEVMGRAVLAYQDRRKAILAEFSYRTVGRHTQQGGSVFVSGGRRRRGRRLGRRS